MNTGLMKTGLSKQTIGILVVLFSSICFAVVPNTAKLALDDNASLYVLLVCRYAIGGMLLAPFMMLTKAGFTVPRQDIRKLVLSSLMALVLLMATYHAVDYLDIGLVLLILYSFPIGVALVRQFKGEETLSSFRWFCMLLVLSGLGIMVYDGQSDINLYGLFICLVGLISFVGFIISSSQLAMTLGSQTLNFYISLIGITVLSLLFILPLGFTLAWPDSSTGVMAILGNGFFYVVSWVLFFEGARLIGATRASLMACVEPLFAALLALIFLNQQLSMVEWAGFFIVLSAIFFFEKAARPDASL